MDYFESQVLKQNQILNAINKVFRETLLCETIEEVAQTCLEVAQELTGCPYGWICDVNPLGGLDVVAFSNQTHTGPGAHPEGAGARLEIEGCWKEVVKEKGPVIMNRTDAFLDRLGAWTGQSGVNRFLGIPLKQAGSTTGVVAVVNKETAFEVEDQRTLQLLCVAFGEAINRKRSEQAINRYSKELWQSNEELKHFTYFASHDLKAPLISLKGFATDLRDSMEELRKILEPVRRHLSEEDQERLRFTMEEDVPEALGFIDVSVERMGRLIEAILRLSRLGRRELILETIDMNHLVQRTLDSMAHHLASGKVKVSVESLPEVFGDWTSLEQIMGNLLHNAILYLDPERPGRIEVSAEQDARGITFHVRDNGRGIPEASLPRVFDVFTRVGDHDVPGEGMGLAYVRAMIRRHGGGIECRSILGEGTTFSFTIPSPLGREGTMQEARTDA